MTWTESILREFIRPAARLTLADWARKEYALDKTAATGGNFDTAFGPWVEDILQAWRNPEYNDLFVSIGLQLFKTTTGGVCLGDVVCHDPGPACWYHNDRHQLADFVKSRLYDSWEKTPPIARLLPPKSDGRSVETVNFATMPVSFLAAESETSQTGRPARYIFGDEIKDWTPGIWSTVK